MRFLSSIVMALAAVLSTAGVTQAQACAAGEMPISFNLLHTDPDGANYTHPSGANIAHNYGTSNSALLDNCTGANLTRGWITGGTKTITVTNGVIFRQVLNQVGHFNGGLIDALNFSPALTTTLTPGACGAAFSVNATGGLSHDGSVKAFIYADKLDSTFAPITTLDHKWNNTNDILSMEFEGCAPDADGDGNTDAVDPLPNCANTFDVFNPDGTIASSTPNPFGSTLDGDCDGDGNLAVALGGTDTNDADPCVDPTTAPATNDCDADGTTVGAGDTDDYDACVNPVYDPAINIPGGTAGDCDDDGVLGTDPLEVDDADPCLPNPCGDAGVALASLDESRSAMKALASVHDHMAYRLATSGMHHDEYLLNFGGTDNQSFEAHGVVSHVDPDSGARWTAAGVSYINRPGAASGEGYFAYVLAGEDVTHTEESIAGYHYGAEVGYWDYDAETSVLKVGGSIGVYGAQKLGDNAMVSGTLTYTHFVNQMEDMDGETATGQSGRLIASVRLGGSFGEEDGWQFEPFIDAQYAVEYHDEYEYSDGDSFGPETVEVGDVGIGIEVISPFDPETGQFYGRLEANQEFGTSTVILSDGSTLGGEEDPTGAVAVGWVSNTGEDSIGTVEVSASGLGSDNREEYRVDAHWERNY